MAEASTGPLEREGDLVRIAADRVALAFQSLHEDDQRGLVDRDGRRIVAAGEGPGHEQPGVGLRVDRSRGVADLWTRIRRTRIDGHQPPGLVDDVDRMVDPVLVGDDDAERLR